MASTNQEQKYRIEPCATGFFEGVIEYTSKHIADKKDPTILHQEDQYFVKKTKNASKNNVENTFAAYERLKLRTIRDITNDLSCVQLIAYNRPNAGGLQKSEYLKIDCIEGTEECATIHKTIRDFYKKSVVVKKVRTLFMFDTHTRIHLDDVEGLGHFLEFEFVVPQTAADGATVTKFGTNYEEVFEYLEKKYRLKDERFYKRIYVSYSDLIASKK